MTIVYACSTGMWFLHGTASLPIIFSLSLSFVRLGTRFDLKCSQCKVHLCICQSFLRVKIYFGISHHNKTAWSACPIHQSKPQIWQTNVHQPLLIAGLCWCFCQILLFLIYCTIIHEIKDLFVKYHGLKGPL